MTTHLLFLSFLLLLLPSTVLKYITNTKWLLKEVDLTYKSVNKNKHHYYFTVWTDLESVVKEGDQVMEKWDFI